MIGIVDYGVANLGSIQNMLRKLGVQAKIVSGLSDFEQADKIILPGVGSFDYGMSALAARGFIDPLKKQVLEKKVPILGICLGMQLLSKGSAEGGAVDGLDLIDGFCVRFSSDGEQRLKIPHMGWNEISFRSESPLFTNLESPARFYFVHSYHMVCTDPADVLATAFHGIEFTAIVQKGNIWGTQFHPEKSHRFGMTLLNNFARI